MDTRIQIHTNFQYLYTNTEKLRPMETNRQSPILKYSRRRVSAPSGMLLPPSNLPGKSVFPDPGACFQPFWVSKHICFYPNPNAQTKAGTRYITYIMLSCTETGHQEPVWKSLDVIGQASMTQVGPYIIVNASK